MNNQEETRVYIGPTIHRRAMVAGRIFRGGLPDYATRLVEKVPELGRLIVPLAEVARARRRITEPGAEENRLHQYLLTIRFDGNREVRQ